MQAWRESIQAALNKAKGITPASNTNFTSTTSSTSNSDTNTQPEKDYQPDMGPDSHAKIGPDDFEKLMVIGQGSFGTVVLCRHKADGQIYAMKILNKKSIVERGEVCLMRYVIHFLHSFIIMPGRSY